MTIASQFNVIGKTSQIFKVMINNKINWMMINNIVKIFKTLVHASNDSVIFLVDDRIEPRKDPPVDPDVEVFVDG